MALRGTQNPGQGMGQDQDLALGVSGPSGQVDELPELLISGPAILGAEHGHDLTPN